MLCIVNFLTSDYSLSYFIKRGNLLVSSHKVPSVSLTYIIKFYLVLFDSTWFAMHTNIYIYIYISSK